MPTTPTPETPHIPEFPPVTEFGAKTLDAVCAISEAGQRIGGQLIELWASTASDRLRAIAELQSAALDATREVLTPIKPREAFEELRQDPTALYRKSMASMLDGTQRAFKLMEANAQIAARSAERFQGSAQRAGQEIESALTTCAGRLRELYTTRS